MQNKVQLFENREGRVVRIKISFITNIYLLYLAIPILYYLPRVIMLSYGNSRHTMPDAASW